MFGVFQIQQSMICLKSMFYRLVEDVAMEWTEWALLWTVRLSLIIQCISDINEPTSINERMDVFCMSSPERHYRRRNPGNWEYV